MDVMTMVLDLMHAHLFRCQMEKRVKMLLFLVWIIVHQHKLIMEKKGSLVLGEGPTDGLDDTTLMTKAKYSVNITGSRKKICISLHCNASNSALYVNDVKIYQSTAKDCKIKPYPQLDS